MVPSIFFSSCVLPCCLSGTRNDPRRRSLLEYDADCDANAGIIRVAQVIPIADVINVNVVGVVPPYRPGLNKSEPKATVLKARIPANHRWAADSELVPAAKIGMEALVRYASAASGAEPQCRHRALPLFFSRTPLGALLLWPAPLLCLLLVLALLHRFALLGSLSILLLSRLGLLLLMLSRLRRVTLLGMLLSGPRLLRLLLVLCILCVAAPLGLLSPLLLHGFGLLALLVMSSLLRGTSLLRFLGRLGFLFVLVLLRVDRSRDS
jgi:hypothetical protein